MMTRSGNGLNGPRSLRIRCCQFLSNGLNNSHIFAHASIDTHGFTFIQFAVMVRRWNAFLVTRLQHAIYDRQQ